MMSSPGLSKESPSSSSGLEVTGIFDKLWTQLKECHDNALKGLQAKVKWLKKKRCLDAQILEGLFNRNQLLQEQNKALQDTVTALEERLRAGLCDCCTVTEEYMKKKQAVFEESVAERDCPLEKDRQRIKELDGLKESCSSGEQEGVIPDSPPKHISMPVVRKMRRRKETRVRYSEEHLPLTQSSAISGKRERMFSLSSQSPKRGLLVPETCEMEKTQAPQCCSQSPVVAETCCLDFPDCLASSELAANAKRSPVFGKSVPSSAQPGTTESPSLLHNPKLSSTRKQILCLEEKGIPCIAPQRPVKGSELDRREGRAERSGERKKDLSETHRDTLNDKGQWPALQRTRVPKAKILTNSSIPGLQKLEEAQHITPFKHPSTSHKSSKGNSTNHEANDIKKPICYSILEETEDLKTSVLQPNSCAWEKKSTHNKTETGTLIPVEPMWSLDSKLSLSQYNIDTPTTVERKPCEEGEMVDMDCTFVSHSLLLQGLIHNGRDISTVPEIGQKANNSLAEVFDQTTFGEYESCPQNNDSHLDQQEHHHEEEEQGEEDEAQKHQNIPLMHNGAPKDSPTFAHVAVVRNREERRKLLGHTCKECEMYYADLPEAERLKKLSSCSRHRFRYIPPSTPENFWEVGFPSTQTCVERGYIKEDNEPEQRIRRKRPYNVIFSPKLKKKNDDQ